MFPQAEGILKNLCTLYSDEGWFDLVYSLKIQLAECQKYLRHKDHYILSCLDLLSPQFSLPQEQKEFYLQEIVQLSSTFEETTSI
jgi:hypothetical protein